MSCMRTPIAFTAAGTPLYPISGGAPELGEGEELNRDIAAEEPDEADEAEPSDDEGNGEEDLGDKGKKAIDAIRAERDKEKGRAREARDALKPYQALTKRFGSLDEITARLEGKVEGEDGKKINVADLRREIETEVASRYAVRIADAQIQQLAAETFQNAADALAFLDRSAISVGEDGTLEESEVKEALADVLASRPYLARKAGSPKDPAPRSPKASRGRGNGDDSTKNKGGSVEDGINAWKNGKKTKQSVA